MLAMRSLSIPLLLSPVLALAIKTQQWSEVKAPVPSLKVAFAVFITELGSESWKDAVAILAHGVKSAAKRSHHDIELLALVPESFKEEHKQFLLRYGYSQVLRKPVPVPPAEIQKPAVREAMEKIMGGSKDVQFLMAHEQIKYWGLTLTQYDRVLVLDADTMVLDPMDELMEREEDFIGTYDHGLDVPQSAAPPVQGGFLLFRPNLTDFELIKDLTREGDFRYDGTGWKGSGIGYCYGGTGPDGMTSYMFHKDALSELRRIGKRNLPEGLNVPPVPGTRILVVDRAVYDVLFNERLLEDVKKARAARRESEFSWVSRIKSAHFTGNCLKPWSCIDTSEACGKVKDKWWKLRAEVATEHGKDPSRSCGGGDYQPLGLE